MVEDGGCHEALRLGNNRFSEFEKSFDTQTLLIIKYPPGLYSQLGHMVQMRGYVASRHLT